MVTDVRNTPAVEIAHVIIESLINIDRHAPPSGAAFTTRELREIIWPRVCEYIEIHNSHLDCFENCFNHFVEFYVNTWTADVAKKPSSFTFWTAAVLIFLETHEGDYKLRGVH